MEKDILYEAARFYRDNLENKRFLIRAGDRKRKEHEIEVCFLPHYFFHTAGLQYLEDLDYIQPRNQSTEKTYIEILNRKLTYNDISKSSFIAKLSGRLDFYTKFMSIFLNPDNFAKSREGRFSKIRANYIMSKHLEIENKYGFLFFVRQNEISVPCSFFTRDDSGSFYFNEGSRLTILSIKDITNEARDKQKTKNTTSTSTPTAKIPAAVGAAVSQPTDAAAASSTPQSNDAASQPNSATAQPSVSAAAASMFGNMPTVQAQNPQSIHTKQKKNDNISE